MSKNVWITALMRYVNLLYTIHLYIELLTGPGFLPGSKIYKTKHIFLTPHHPMSNAFLTLANRSLFWKRMVWLWNLSSKAHLRLYNACWFKHHFLAHQQVFWIWSCRFSGSWSDPPLLRCFHLSFAIQFIKESITTWYSSHPTLRLTQ